MQRARRVLLDHEQLAAAAHSRSGTEACSWSSHVVAEPSLGARQSPRGDNDPPDPTFGALGMAER
jgi:hypothetical protein